MTLHQIDHHYSISTSFRQDPWCLGDLFFSSFTLFFTWNLIPSALCDSLVKNNKKPIFLFCYQKNVLETQMDLTKICVLPSSCNNQMKTLKLFYPLPSIITFCSIFYHFFSHKELVSTFFFPASYVLTSIQVQPDNPPITTKYFFSLKTDN